MGGGRAAGAGQRLLTNLRTAVGGPTEHQLQVDTWGGLGLLSLLPLSSPGCSSSVGGLSCCSWSGGYTSATVWLQEAARSLGSWLLPADAREESRQQRPRDPPSLLSPNPLISTPGCTNLGFSIQKVWKQFQKGIKMKEGKSSNSSSSQCVEKAGLPRHLCLDSQHSHHLLMPSFRAWALKFVPSGFALVTC